jgi:REP element-mobilizing transposase RayT
VSSHDPNTIKKLVCERLAPSHFVTHSLRRAVTYQPRATPWGPGIPNSRESPEGAQQEGVTIMSQSLVKNLIHLVYSTRHRQPLLSAAIGPKLYAYQAGILKQWDSPALVIGGVEDHVHALFSLCKNHALKDIVEQVKKRSSKWVKNEDPRVQDFYWQGDMRRSRSASPMWTP